VSNTKRAILAAKYLENSGAMANRESKLSSGKDTILRRALERNAGGGN